MKKIEEVELPKELRYSPDHEWIRAGGGALRIGITDYAQDQLGDIVYCELPAVGVRFAQGVVFATLESVKSVSECFLPLAGEVVAVNEALADRPEIINQSPYADGWMVELRPDDPAAIETLLTAEGYRARLTGGA